MRMAFALLRGFHMVPEVLFENAHSGRRRVSWPDTTVSLSGSSYWEMVRTELLRLSLTCEVTL